MDWQEKANPNVMALDFLMAFIMGMGSHQNGLTEGKGKECALAVMSFFPHPKTVIRKGKSNFII